MNNQTLYCASYDLCGYELRCMSTTKDKARKLLWKAYVNYWKLDGCETPYPWNIWKDSISIDSFKLDEAYWGESIIETN